MVGAVIPAVVYPCRETTLYNKINYSVHIFLLSILYFIKYHNIFDRLVNKYKCTHI